MVWIIKEITTFLSSESYSSKNIGITNYHSKVSELLKYNQSLCNKLAFSMSEMGTYNICNEKFPYPDD